MRGFILNNIKWEDLKAKFLAGKPKEVEGLNNISANRYRRYLLRKLMGQFKIENMPDDWCYNYVLKTLFTLGYIAITNTDIGIVAVECGFSGINYQYQPTTIIIANPILGNLERTIHEDAVLWHLQYNYQSVNDILDRYSYLLASCDASMSINMLNTRSVNVGYAENKAQAATLEKAYDDAAMGKPLVVIKPSSLDKSQDLNKMPWVFNPVKNAFIADEIENLKRQIVEDFLMEIGINAVNVRKKERTNTAEVQANDEEVFNASAHWLETLNQGCEEANKMFELNMHVILNKEEKNEPSESI